MVPDNKAVSICTRRYLAVSGMFGQRAQAKIQSAAMFTKGMKATRTHHPEKPSLRRTFQIGHPHPTKKTIRTIQCQMLVAPITAPR